MDLQQDTQEHAKLLKNHSTQVSLGPFNSNLDPKNTLFHSVEIRLQLLPAQHRNKENEVARLLRHLFEQVVGTSKVELRSKLQRLQSFFRRGEVQLIAPLWIRQWMWSEGQVMNSR
ncbi:unnamed protein product [Prunus armeniaca]